MKTRHVKTGIQKAGIQTWIQTGSALGRTSLQRWGWGQPSSPGTASQRKRAAVSLVEKGHGDGSAPPWVRMLNGLWRKVCASYSLSTPRRLRVAETITLGEKRFVAIVAVEGKEFLIGGGTAGMSLLAELEAAPAKRKNGKAGLGGRLASGPERVEARAGDGKRAAGKVAVGKVAAGKVAAGKVAAGKMEVGRVGAGAGAAGLDVVGGAG